MTESEMHDELDLLKQVFPDLDGDAVERAWREIDYMETFPEDMVEERTSWDSLLDTVHSLQNGFNALYSVVHRVAEDRSYE